MVSQRSLTLVAVLGIIGAVAMWALLSAWTPASAVTNSYIQTNLVSDNGVPGTKHDAKLINPWGVAFFPGNPFWVNDQGTGVSELLDGKGNSGGSFIIPSSPGVFPSGPTGIVANNPPSQFLVGGSPALFIFDGLDGTITAWNSGLKAVIMVNNSTTAKYTGLAMAKIGANPFLYAANSFGGVDVFDGKFKPFKTTGGFVDHGIPLGLTPFGIANIEGNLFVTYAPRFGGGGIVDEFTPQGVLIRRFATNGTLNQPWAVVMAPASFGMFSNALLIGNFGNGTISAFNFTTGGFLGQLDSKGVPLKIDGLWALTLGDTVPNHAANLNALYFTAGPNGQADGLFGYILPSPGSGPTPTPTHTKRPTPTPTKRPTPTHTKRPTPTHTKRPTPTPTKRPTPTHTKRPTPSPTKRPTPTLGKGPTHTPTKRPTPTHTKRPTATATKRPTPTHTKRQTPTATRKPTPTPTRYIGGTRTPTPTYTYIYPY